MKKRINIILSCILGLQVIFILFLDKPWTTGYAARQTMDESEMILFPGYSVDKAHTIRISQGSKEITLQKESPNRWYIPQKEKNCLADIRWVDILLESLGRAKISDVVSSDPETYREYEVDEKQGIHVQILDITGALLANLVVGKNMGPLRGTFVRKVGSDDVMLIMENVRRGVNKGDNWMHAWRDRTIHIERRSGKVVDSLELINKQGRMLFERRNMGGAEGEEEYEWWMTFPVEGKASMQHLNHMVPPLCGLKAMAFCPHGARPEQVGLDNPGLIVTLGKVTGEKIVFEITDPGKQGAEKSIRYLKSTITGDEIFKVSSASFTYFLYKTEAYLEKE